MECSDFQLLPMTADDYDEVIALWNACEGVRANETRHELSRILARNEGLSAVFRSGGEMAAAILCCHDGRRGYLYHLGVAAKFRRHGLAKRLVENSLNGLRAAGIGRCSIFLITTNVSGEAFWRQIGWDERDDLKVFACDI
jgi:ribosomal protein S18 acetylase RimI-like enzyme